MAEKIRSSLRILRRKEVEARCGLSRSTIYNFMAEGTFPRAIPIGPHAVGWVASEIDAWIEQQIAKRDQGSI